jgi:hypothetical protein
MSMQTYVAVAVKIPSDRTFENMLSARENSAVKRTMSPMRTRGGRTKYRTRMVKVGRRDPTIVPIVLLNLVIFWSEYSRYAVVGC